VPHQSFFRGVNLKYFQDETQSTYNSSYSVIVRVSVVLGGAAVGDWRFGGLGGGRLRGRVGGVCRSMMLWVWSVERGWSV